MMPSMAAQPILILGTGGNAIDILDTLLCLNRTGTEAFWEPRGFLDDDPARQGTRIHSYPVLGPIEAAMSFPECRLVNGIGSPSSYLGKAALITRTGASAERFATLIHPTASVSSLARLGLGTVLLQQTVVASNASVGSHAIILPQSVVSHDAEVGDFSCIAGGVVLCGGVHVGTSCYIGAGSLIRQGVRVGDGALVGMGAVVVRDVPPGATVAGNPARPLARRPASTLA